MSQQPELRPHSASWRALWRPFPACQHAAVTAAAVAVTEAAAVTATAAALAASVRLPGDRPSGPGETRGSWWASWDHSPTAGIAR